MKFIKEEDMQSVTSGLYDGRMDEEPVCAVLLGPESDPRL